MKLAITAIGILAQTAEELNRAFPGWIWNAATARWEAATTESLAARQAAINEVMGAVLDGLPFPISLGTVGSLDRAKADLAVQKITAAMAAYVTATTKTSA